MMRAKVIKTKEDYEAALARIDVLMEADSGLQKDVDDLELLAVLVERYEDEICPIELPSPVEALRFRMEQQGLRQSDLVSYIGSKSKVSEVLSGKIPLSLQMIRKLHFGLGIPAEVLLNKPNAELPDDTEIDWNEFPIAEMLKRGWFEGFHGTTNEAKLNAEELVTEFAKDVGTELLRPVFCRASNTTSKEMNPYALAAWRVKVVKDSIKETLPEYVPGTVTKKFVKYLVGLSFFENGPLLAKEYLNKHGIHLIIVSHLPKTYLDGATMFSSQNRPIIALSLRHDRIDNFWFTLCHELAHIALHLREHSEMTFLFDDLDHPPSEQIEKEADEWASSVMLDPTKWSRAAFSDKSSQTEIIDWSNGERISPAIAAGRIRKESGNYRVFFTLVGSKQVRQQLTRSN